MIKRGAERVLRRRGGLEEGNRLHRHAIQNFLALWEFKVEPSIGKTRIAGKHRPLKEKEKGNSTCPTRTQQRHGSPLERTD